MSRTARCLFAIGLGVSLAAACGDDDGGDGTAGTGGAAGRGGTGGTAGRGGTAGVGGAAGGGSGGQATGGGGAGSGGVAGTAGTGGGTAGTAGTAGTGGEEPPDGGVDGGGDAAPDGGGGSGTCPNFTTASAGANSGNINQEVIITRLVFDGPEVAVTFRAINQEFNFGDPLLLCTGSEFDDCDDVVQGITGTGTAGALAVGEEATVTTALGLVDASSGEIALVNGFPSGLDGGVLSPIVRTYVNWGDYNSLDPTSGVTQDLETRADDEAVWVSGDSIDPGTDTTIFATGADIRTAAAFDVCTQ